jgi:Sulfotransferase family
VHDHTFIFIGGLQRSGTTMLAKYVSEHPDISGLHGTPRPAHEGQHNQTVYPDAERHGRAGRFGFMKESRLTEESPLVTEANRRKLFEEWSPFWNLEKPYLLEKSPPNIIRMRFLQAMFPRSSCILIMRHPIPVSCATQKWSDTRPHHLLRHWLVCHGLFASDVPHLERVHVVRYEDLIADPSVTLGGVWRFLGVDPYDVERPVAAGINADHLLRDGVARRDVNAKYFESWERRKHTAVRRAYFALTERAYEPRARRFGYSLLDHDLLAPPTIDLPGLSPAPRREAAAAA